eukprot:Blabericola_migrator_1__3973@NODE_2201_length_3137_cov_57_500000_g1386_i0_p2_GENE_NODE_2201_length_3137_cov_57_500000_g1386_i0NODE_2201_length_3137_cov_57_500000_g1386_i0_p2_ORF_typecomplete_len280_score34_05_NODE_2201_length_3137_cov_57_500000_g1386_i014992338
MFILFVLALILWNVTSDNGDEVICETVPSYQLLELDWPLPDLDVSDCINLPMSPEILIPSGYKPNPDAVPICSEWIKFDRNTLSSCQETCGSRLYKCYSRPQLWENKEWRSPSVDLGIVTSNWNGPVDCVLEDLIDECYGPCRSAHNLTAVTECMILVDQCFSSTHDKSHYLPSESVSDDDTTEVSGDTTDVSHDTTTEALDEVTIWISPNEQDEGGNMDDMPSSATQTIITASVLTTGATAIAIGACCHSGFFKGTPNGTEHAPPGMNEATNTLEEVK